VNLFRREPPAPESKLRYLPGFALQVGDVVTLEAEELWFESGWLLGEAERPYAAILFCAEANLLVLSEPRATIFRLSEVPVELPLALPRTIELLGRSFEQRRRVPVELSALGSLSAVPWASAILAEYRASGGDSLWLIAGAGRSKAWLARSVQLSEIDVWGRT
jgi:hypothetical protein